MRVEYKPIRDYAIIGNLRSAVLVSKDGSVDWAPAPFIDSPSIFAAILDKEKGGYWSIQPCAEFTSRQEYIPETNIVKTIFETKDGALELTDFIPIEEEKNFLPADEDTTFKLKRRIACTRGTCSVQMQFYPRFDYARGDTELSYTDGGVYVQNGRKHGVLGSTHPLEIQGDHVFADVQLKEGDVDFFIFRYNAEKIPPRDIREDDEAYHEQELRETEEFWRSWIGTCDLSNCELPGFCRDIILRSALVLKILFFEPIGTIAAAATTSLPEEIGGVRNWDYRYTWLRDSSFLLQAFFRLGHVSEAKKYIAWLVRQCHKVQSAEDGGKKKFEAAKMNIVYGLRGETEIEEEILTHLEGYRGSQPVRIGNDAYKQEQWDIYGSVLDMVWSLHELEGGEVVDKGKWAILRQIANYVATVWREPDEGLWEVRGGKSHFVYSKVMCWVALDRAIRIAEAYSFEGETDVWENEREAIRHAVFEKGWHADMQAFTQSFDSHNLDAAVLLMPTVGFIDGTDPRMLSTIHAIEEKLGCGQGLFRRYTSEDGLPGEEGAFLLASFWMVDALVYAGERDRALELFDIVRHKANHVGLFSEEMQADTFDFLGNFPQAYTHIGLINSAYLLAGNT